MLRRLLIENNKVVLEFDTCNDAYKFVELLRVLGVGRIEKREVRIEYDERFYEYMLKDRRIDKKTARDYMNYLKKLSGKIINYDLYLSIANNKWKIKTVRLYLDFLYKTNRISWEEKERLKSLFKLKSSRSDDDEYEVDIEKLVVTIRSIKDNKELDAVILKLLYYSGARLSEVLKLLREWDNKRLVCNEVFCRYKMKWMRGRKRCDYIYFPRWLLQEIELYAHKVNLENNTVVKRIEGKYGVNTKDYRKLHYRICRDVIGDDSICDFYQSRMSKMTIGHKHYDDMRSRADKHYQILMRSLDELINKV